MTVREKLEDHLKNMEDDTVFLRKSVVTALHYADILHARKIDYDRTDLMAYKEFLQNANGPQRETRVALSKIYSDLIRKGMTMSKDSIVGGIGVMIFLAISLSLLFIFAVFPDYFGFDISLHPYYKSDSSLDPSDVTEQSIPKILSIPVYVYVWGIIGTLAYLIWSCVTHIGSKDFDNHFIPWYVFRISLGAIMAAVIYLVFVSGFITINSGQTATDFESDPRPIMVLAVLSGFSIRYSMDTIDRVARAFMPNSKKTDDEIR